MKVIFLDVDGVLNTKKTKDRVSFPPWGQKFRGLDNGKVRRVSKLALETGAKVVISSTWREYMDLDELRGLLSKRGFRAEIIGKTPHGGMTRGEEIQGWIDLNGMPDSFVVLDDIATQFLSCGQQVQTDDSGGFTVGYYKQAFSILIKEI